ncbi:MAG: DNA (cytosine-5-)-methyltransferase [Bacteroidaceae bacterium]|nr:DNA (cytosine-5-)-methyltransferase [Bacteroidaceae bacterium]
MSKKYKVASLFCGCGGSDLGMIGGFSFLDKTYEELPFDIVYAIDFDQKAVETYNRNFAHPAECIDVCDADFSSIGDVDVLIGGFPCQSFSTVNPTKDTNDARANLYKQIVRFLMEKKPKYFICENVKGLLTLQKGAIIRKITKEFSEAGYKVVYRLVHAVEYGVPQKRERAIIVGIRKDIEGTFYYPQRVYGKTTPLKAVIDNLAIDEQKYYFSEKAVQGMRNAKNNMKRGLWQDLNQPCLTITSHLAKTSINSRDPVLLVDADKDLYRRFTPREAARIQSFPNSFLLPESDSAAYRQIGNAVPPVMMWHIAKALQNCIENKNQPKSYDFLSSDEWSGKTAIQLSLFEPTSLYISKNMQRLVGTCRQGTRKWIADNLLYNYPIEEDTLQLHPELATVKQVVVKYRNTIVGNYIVKECAIVTKKELKELGYPVKSSKRKADSKYILYTLETSVEDVPNIIAEDYRCILGKGVWKKL